MCIYTMQYVDITYVHIYVHIYYVIYIYVIYGYNF